jgi:hypothetical protein
MEDGALRRRDGADCDNSRAMAGERWAGGCSREELMVVSDVRGRRSAEDVPSTSVFLAVSVQSFNPRVI